MELRCGLLIAAFVAVFEFWCGRGKVGFTPRPSMKASECFLSIQGLSGIALFRFNPTCIRIVCFDSGNEDVTAWPWTRVGTFT